MKPLLMSSAGMSQVINASTGCMVALAPDPWSLVGTCTPGILLWDNGNEAQPTGIQTPQFGSRGVSSRRCSQL